MPRGWARPLADEDMPQLRRALSIVARKDGARGGPKTRDQIAVARDLMILKGLSEGRTQAEIGEALGLSRLDVGTYRQAIRARLAKVAAQAARG